MPDPAVINRTVDHTVDPTSFIHDMLTAGAGDGDGFTAPSARPGVAFTIKRFILNLLLDKAATVVPAKEVMPVLKCFQLDVAPGRLRVTASDMELSLIAATELVDVHTPGVAVFPAGKLLAIVREADDGDAVIRVAGQRAAITIGRTTWNLVLPGGADYPAMPSITEATFVQVERAVFAAALGAVRYAASRDANRANLMMIDVRGGRMTACDGHRLAQAPVPAFPFTFQIPISAVLDLVKLLKGCDAEHISVGDAGGHLIFRLGADVFIVSKMAAQFPDLEALWLRPALANTYPLSVDRAELLQAIKRVRITADTNTSAIALLLGPDRVTVAARDTCNNTAEEPIAALWSGPARTLVLNHAYLSDMLTGHHGPNAQFLLGEDTKTRKAPIMLRDPEAGTTAVLGQMNLDWAVA